MLNDAALNNGLKAMHSKDRRTKLTRSVHKHLLLGHINGCTIGIDISDNLQWHTINAHADV